MKKTAFSTFLIVLLCALAYLRRPDLAFHQEQLLAHAALLAGEKAVTVGSKPPLLLHDLYLFTTTSDPATGQMVSFGFGHYIKILNNDWGKRAFSPQPLPIPR